MKSEKSSIGEEGDREPISRCGVSRGTMWYAEVCAEKLIVITAVVGPPSNTVVGKVLL